MTARRRRAALDAWIDQVESVLQLGRRTVPGPGAAPGAGSEFPPVDAALHPDPADRARGWMSLRAG